MVSLFCSAYSDFGDEKHRTKMRHFRHNLKKLRHGIATSLAAALPDFYRFPER
jgi:hypothetical protein